MDIPTPKGRRSVWTEEELKKIEELWGTMKDADLASLLGKTVSMVRFKATKLGLREKKGKRAGCIKGKVTYPWSKDEDRILVSNIGQLSIFELMSLLPKRNREAIERRCYEMGYSPAQGTYTRAMIEKETGYDWRQVKRAKEALNQTWKRYGIRKYMITDDQRIDIIEYLKNEKRKWARHYDLDACIKCGASGSSERERHSGDGLCKRCWDARRHKRKKIINDLISGRYNIVTNDFWNKVKGE